MMTPITKRITTSTTTTALSTSCVLHQVVIACANAGTSWTMRIQDKTPTNPFIWVPDFTLAIPVDGYPNVIGKFELPIPMNGGIDIVTVGGSPGVVAVCLIISQ